jgi:hypothetical protein
MILVTTTLTWLKMKLSKKRIYAFVGIAALGVGSYFMLRRKRIIFFDNVWCNDDECTKITDALQYCTGEGGYQEGDPSTGGERTIDNSGKQPNNLDSCINEENVLSEQELVYDAQIENGLRDEDGNVLVNSEQEVEDIALQNNAERGNSRSWEDEGYTTGYLNLIFPKPHGLKDGQRIYIGQDDLPEAIGEYNGDAVIEKVLTPYIVRTNKPRVGSTTTVGGYIVLPSLWDELIA